MSSNVITGVRFGDGISIGDRRAIALTEWMGQQTSPLSSDQIKAKIEELRLTLPDPQPLPEDRQ